MFDRSLRKDRCVQGSMLFGMYLLYAHGVLEVRYGSVLAICGRRALSGISIRMG